MELDPIDQGCDYVKERVGQKAGPRRKRNGYSDAFIREKYNLTFIADFGDNAWGYETRQTKRKFCPSETESNMT